MILLIPDANTGSGTSPESATQATDESQQGANAVSPTAEGAEGGAEGGDEKAETVEDIKARIIAKHSKADESPTDSKEKSEENGSVLKSNQTSEEKKEDEPKDKKEVPLVEDDSKLPFHKHPRFQQLTKERTEFKSQLEAVKPLADRMQIIEKFCIENKIPAQDFDESVRLAALVQTDPIAALSKLEGIVDNLRVITGKALPADLQEQVELGKLSQSHAQEMAKLRLQTRNNEQQVKQIQQSTAEREQQQLVSTLNSWTTSKMASDPSFKPKVQGQRDGKYELVVAKFQSMWQRNPPNSVNDAITLAESAYKDVHEFIEQTMPKPAVRRPLNAKPSNEPSPLKVDVSKPGWGRQVAKQTLSKVR